MLATIDRGSGPPVVLLHGQPGTHVSWDPVVGLLEPSLRVLVPDRIGYGATEGEARGVAANAALVARLIEARDAVPATIVAHSWSGAVAVLLADAHPGLVSSLVLVCASCTPDSLDTVDRVLNLSVVGDVLTVAGLLSFGEVLPRLRPLIRYAPARYRDQLSTAFPDRGDLGGEGGTLSRRRRTFLIEQRALIAELPGGHRRSAAHPGPDSGGGGRVGSGRAAGGRSHPGSVGSRSRAGHGAPGRALRGP